MKRNCAFVFVLVGHMFSCVVVAAEILDLRSPVGLGLYVSQGTDTGSPDIFHDKNWLQDKAGSRLGINKTNSDGFAWDVAPNDKNRNPHDVTVTSATSGYIKEVTQVTGAGWQIVVHDDKGIETAYLHLAKPDYPIGVFTKDRFPVTPGMPLGVLASKIDVISTGGTWKTVAGVEGIYVKDASGKDVLMWTGAHLHFAVYYDTTKITPLFDGKNLNTFNETYRVGSSLDQLASTKVVAAGTAPRAAATPNPNLQAATKPTVPTFNQNETLNANGIPTVLTPNYRSGVVVLEGALPAVGWFVTGLYYSFNAANQLIAVNNAAGATASVGSAQVLDAGNGSQAGNAYWGRWFGPGAVAISSSGTEAIPNLHYLVGAQVTNMPTSGIVTYNPAGGTPPTDANGARGRFNGGSILVNFTTRAVGINNLNFSNAVGATFNLNGSTTYNSSAQFASTLSGTCAGGNCIGGTATGASAGTFFGNQAAGVGLSYIGSNLGTGLISGAQAFKR